MVTRRAPIPMRMKVRAGERGSMDYDGSIAQGIELAFYYVKPKYRAGLLSKLQEAHAKLNADEGCEKDGGPVSECGISPTCGCPAALAAITIGETISPLESATERNVCQACCGSGRGNFLDVCGRCKGSGECGSAESS